MDQSWGRGRQTGNNRRPLGDNRALRAGRILNNPRRPRSLVTMKHALASFGFAALLALAASPAAADCYADYKAKRDDPLQLHYGVIQLPDAACASAEAAGAEIAARIGGDGWTLLTVVSTFDAAGLEDGKRKANAGDFYLRY